MEEKGNEICAQWLEGMEYQSSDESCRENNLGCVVVRLPHSTEGEGEVPCHWKCMHRGQRTLWTRSCMDKSRSIEFSLLIMTKGPSSLGNSELLPLGEVSHGI